MDVLKILSGSLIGTTLMTLFSYFLANRLNKPFKEPVLLNKLLFQARFYRSDSKPATAGWIIHYSIGVTFVIGFHLFWKMTAVDPTFLSGTLLGLASGFAGIAGWHLTFSVHSKPPSIDLMQHYLHLLAAHIIFGWGAAAGYSLFKL